jgi:hypothetical protein
MIMNATGQIPAQNSTLKDAGANTLMGTTQHWQSVYSAANDNTLSQDPNRSYRPLWSINRQAYSSKRCLFETENQRALGHYGQNPRAKLPHDSTKQAVNVDELNIGTNKTTHNIPGYTGFIPKTDHNSLAMDQSQVPNVRNTIVK